jgi:hypothetical protein
VAGAFPLDTGGIHGLFALLVFLFFNVQALGTATRLAGAMRALSVVAGGVGLVFVVLMASAIPAPPRRSALSATAVPDG